VSRTHLGFRRCEASMEPSPTCPAPTTVCISSMNRMIRPSAADTSSSTAISLSHVTRRPAHVSVTTRARGAMGASTRFCQLSGRAFLSVERALSALPGAHLSSNCPRCEVPATSAAMSKLTTRLSMSERGTSPLTIRCARPSTIAVFPTPGSPAPPQARQRGVLSVSHTS
jgi:hypothetical protein